MTENTRVNYKNEFCSTEVNSTCYPKFEESLRVEHFTDGQIGNKGYIRTKLILGKGDLSR